MVSARKNLRQKLERLRVENEQVYEVCLVFRDVQEAVFADLSKICLCEFRKVHVFGALLSQNGIVK